MMGKANQHQNKAELFSRKNLFAFALTLAFAIGYPVFFNKYYAVTEFPDCSAYFRLGHRQDGIYEIKPLPHENHRFNVYCNMTAGGWTMIMKRTSKGKVDFGRPMNIYKSGFGDLSGDHFLGLDNIHRLTKQYERQLINTLNRTQFHYRRFEVLDEYYYYKIIVDGEMTRMPDGISFLRINNSLFSTYDVDLDLAAGSNCSSGFGNVGWWFTNCFDLTVCGTCMIMHGNKGVRNLNHFSMMIK